MEPVIWVEVLSRHREVAHRYRCAGAEIRVGRGYDNDVVIDDPFVSARHARILRDEDGSLVVEDRGSANGLYAERGRQRLQRLRLDGNHTFRIGHTVVRVREASHEVVPERVQRPPSRTWPLAIALVVVLMAVEAGFLWLRDVTDPKPDRYVIPLLYIAAFVIGWTSAWSILARIFAGHAQFERNLLITAIGFMVYSWLNELTLFCSFALAWQTPQTYEFVAVWILIGVVCFQHLSLMIHGRQWLRGGLVAALVLVAIATHALTRLDANPAFDRQAYGRQLLPPWFRMVGLHAPDKFLADLDPLRKRLDSDRRKEPGTRPSLLGSDDDGDDDSDD